MRTIWYAVLNTKTGEKTIAGVDYNRAKAILEQKNDENCRIIHKWISI